MYVSPNHPDYERLKDRATAGAPTGPPSPTGSLLAAFPRKGPDGGEQELRVVLDSYEGHDYIAVRLWQRDQAGAGGPSRARASASAWASARASRPRCSRPSTWPPG